MSSRSERLFLIHWDEAGADTLAEPLRQAGWGVEVEAQDGKRAWGAVHDNPPKALVISLGRLPSHGREKALAVRRSAAGRTIPIVFVEGNPANVAAIRARIPEAAYVTQNGLMPALQDALGSE